ncbi:MAG: bL28 family ribosomal protein [Bacilli bacterium]
MAIKVTSKTPLFGNKRSHSCGATKHAQKPNLQKVTLENGLSIRISARELRTLKKADKISA